jgi:hypothetical protein
MKMKRSVYKFVLIDEFGDPLRKFANKQEATPYLTDGAKLVRLPPQPNPYEMALLLVGDALI